MFSKKIFSLLATLVGLTASIGVSAQNLTVSGTVSDAQGPLSGVVVLAPDAGTNAVTDLDGKYTISVKPTSVLEFSCLGYKDTKVQVGSQSVVNVTLAEDNLLLEDAIVLGYGAATKKKDLSASVGIVSQPEKIAARPVSSVNDMLQGQIPGVTVQSDGGSPTSSPWIVIRGQGSQNGDSVLWVVDGVPGAPINSVSDVESIVVLKDAASAAIYGAQSGAGGVILVTTKKAKGQGVSVTYDGVAGVRQATNLPESLNAQEQIEMRKQSYANAGLPLPTAWNPEKNPWIATNRTNWMDEIFRNALFQRHNVSLNYSTEKFKSRLSLAMRENNGVLVGTFSKGTGVNYDGEYQINKWFKLTEKATWSSSTSRGTDTSSGYSGSIISAIYMPQSAEAYDANGHFGGTTTEDPEYIARYGSSFGDAHGDAINPLRLLLANDQVNQYSSFYTSTAAEISNIVTGLKFISRFTYSTGQGMYKNFSPKRTEIGKPDLTNSLNYSTTRDHSWKTENTLTYDRTFGKHTVGGLFSTTADHWYNRGFGVTGKDFADESKFLQYLSYASSIEASDWYGGVDANIALVARVSYSFDDRYFVTGSWRRDYAGRLPKGHNYGDFPAVTGAWKVSSEPFFPKTKTLSLLKVRASWGRIGNLGSIWNNYKSNTLSKDYKHWVAHYGPGTGQFYDTVMYNGNALNQSLTWETSEQYDLGLDVAMFNERLSMQADFYSKKTFNLIQDQTTGWPNTIGVNAMKINQGEISNKGIEFLVSWNDKIGKDWTYNVSANIAYNKNRVVDTGIRNENGETGVWTGGGSYRLVPYIFQSAVGQPLGSFYVIKTAGIFQSEEDVYDHAKDGKLIQPNAKPGDLKFVDFDGDGKITDNDRQYCGTGMPSTTYSLSAGFSYKNLSFSMMLQGIAGAKAAYMAKYSLLDDAEGEFNRSRDILYKTWSPTNTGAKNPRLLKGDPNGNFSTASDYYLESTDYLRLKNITLSYDLTNLIRKCSHFSDRNSSLSVYFSGDNLFTITGYTGMDPEVGNYDALKYPVSRVFSFGVKLTY